MKKIAVLIKVVLKAIIRSYQYAISPMLGQHCQHTPTCSQYAWLAIDEWGVLRGTWLGVKRIARCHPWGTHGYDPVPHRPTSEKETQQ